MSNLSALRPTLTVEERGAMFQVIEDVYLTKKVLKCGLCSEIFMTAFAHYAQYIESLPCGDSLYVINNEGKSWFASNKTI